MKTLRTIVIGLLLLGVVIGLWGAWGFFPKQIVPATPGLKITAVECNGLTSNYVSVETEITTRFNGVVKESTNLYEIGYDRREFHFSSTDRSEFLEVYLEAKQADDSWTVRGIMMVDNKQLPQVTATISCR